MKQWIPVWHQAVTESFNKGKAFGKDKTITFTVHSPVDADQVRIRFSNMLGQEPCQIDAISIINEYSRMPVKLSGKTSFSIPAGQKIYSDPIDFPVPKNSEITVRMYYTSYILDCNMIEDAADLQKGNVIDTRISDTISKPLLAKVLGVANAIPSIDRIEVETDKEVKSIVAFGDSITAMSKWTKPLSKRLGQQYGEKYILLNSGISGNCLLYKVPGIMGSVFGEKGTKRFAQDVLDVPNLGVVIIGLGVNDVSYYTEETKEEINFEAFKKEITKIVDLLHERNVRVIMQTITPRNKVAFTMGKYFPEMEEQRLLWNEWIRSAGIFDYVFDAEEVVRDRDEKGYFFKEGIHMG
ncbi:MAG: hypothetical protein IKR11_07165, partial [Solobacterium sp.]|nr:hypothetical protein [Solobacterium sp.]